ncbi:MAG: hemolysin III family protein [Treponema sp.]|nr:hemolysin III family protein [Treponema sp.]
MNPFPSYTISEEIANSVLHGFGALLATAGLVLLSLRAGGLLGGQGGGSLDIIAVIVFTSTMIVMFLISTVYHAIQHPGTKRIMRKLDHSIIFVFIAGTYTPLSLSGLGGAWGWSLFAFQWTMVVLGITLNFLDIKAMKKVQIAVYLMMGWAVIVGFVPLLQSVPGRSVFLIFLGGVIYSLGIIFYRRQKIKFMHSVWHVFVMIGAICHWFAVWYII